MGPHNTDTMSTYIGLSANQFQQITNAVIPSLLEIFKCPMKSRIAVYVYLMKLRTDNTFDQIAPHFNVCPKTISSWIRKTRDIVHTELVRLHLYRRKRNDLIWNTTPLSRKIYDASENNAVVVFDATYVFTIKSSNYEFQKKSYSAQFGRNLVKFMLCVTTNGLILNTYGPFNATKNDAVILKEIMDEPGTIFDILQPRDVLVVDRGFKDVIPILKSRGFVIHVPKGTKANHLLRADANESRFATKTRFVVEVRNSHIKKKWKHLSGTKIHQFIPYLKKDFEVCTALVNAFSCKIISDKNDWNDIADLMLDKRNQLNHLQTIVHRIRDNAFTAVPNLTLFPKLLLSDLKKISQGSYQIRQSTSYCQSHLKENNNTFITKICDANICQQLCGHLLDNTSNPLLLSMDLKSRFQSNRFHRVYVLLSLDFNNKYVVNQFCCSCRHGRRTVGCCSHVMALLWYTLHIDSTTMRFPSSNFDNVFDKWDDEYSFSSSDTNSFTD